MYITIIHRNFATSNQKQQHIMPKIYAKKQIRYGLWVMECPKCGKVCASASDLYLLPQFTSCDCDKETYFNTNYNKTHYRVVHVPMDGVTEQYDREYVDQARLIFDGLVKKLNYKRITLFEIHEDGTYVVLRERKDNL